MQKRLMSDLSLAPAHRGAGHAVSVLRRLALAGACVLAAGLAGLAFLWLDHKVHTTEHRIFVEYLDSEAGEATIDGLPEAEPAAIRSDRIGSVVIAVHQADRRVRMGLVTPFADSTARMNAILRERCYYDARLLPYEDLWSERLMRLWRPRRSASAEHEDTRRPMAIIEARFAYCDPNGLTRRERRLRDRPQTAREWLDRLTAEPARPTP